MELFPRPGLEVRAMDGIHPDKGKGIVYVVHGMMHGMIPGIVQVGYGKVQTAVAHRTNKACVSLLKNGVVVLASGIPADDVRRAHL
eukprot:scaffold323_cov363-Pavlova_lutheri.AAC.3